MFNMMHVYVFSILLVDTSCEPPAGASNSRQRYCSCMHRVIVEYMYVGPMWTGMKQLVLHMST